MSRSRTARAAAAAVATAALLPVLSAAPAEAKGREVVRSGACSASAHWKLKVSTDNGRLEVEGEVDSNRAGQRWTWAMVHNGSVSARGVRWTAGRSGSFEVRRLMANRAGTDRVVFRALRPATGQRCRGVVRF